MFPYLQRRTEHKGCPATPRPATRIQLQREFHSAGPLETPVRTKKPLKRIRGRPASSSRSQCVAARAVAAPPTLLGGRRDFEKIGKRSTAIRSKVPWAGQSGVHSTQHATLSTAERFTLHVAAREKQLHQQPQTIMKTTIVLTLAASAYAMCPNSCSGHGSCGNDDLCHCICLSRPVCR